MNSGPPTRPNDGDRPDATPNRRGSWLWILLFAGLLYVILTSVFPSESRNAAEVDYNRFIEEIEQHSDNIKSIKEIQVGTFKATFKSQVNFAPPDQEDATPHPYDAFTCVITSDELKSDLAKLVHAQESRPQLRFKDTSGEVLQFLLVQILPLILLVLIFWFMASRVRKQMGGPGIFGKFGGNRAKRHDSTKTQVTFEDVASLKNVKTELSEIVSFLKHPDRYTRLGARIPKGVLLVGPPGTGKTLLARAVAGEAGVPFFSISGSEFIELFVGMGASRVRELFDEAKKSAPCIVFIDEIDAVGRSRGTGLGGGHDEREQTLNQILSEMDGFEGNQSVIVLAATNRPDVLDPALVRPGRFDRQVVVERPQRDGRRAILEVHTKEIPLAADVDLDSIARATIGFSGADLRNLANEAALMAARDGKELVTRRDFDNARDKITLGTLRDEAMTQKERVLTAYHEAGHALLALLLPESDPVQTVTIVPRGRALGVTMQTPSEEVSNHSRTYLIHRVIIALGGRAAEELVFNEFTTGAENDLQQSTGLVERMVCRWGMSEKLGPVAFPRGEEHVFLGRELGESKHYSEHTAMLIDDEIRRIVDQCYATAMEMLERERERLEKLSKELLEREILVDREIYELLDFPVPPALQHEEPQAPTPPPVPHAPAGSSESSAGQEDIDPRLLGFEGA